MGASFGWNDVSHGSGVKSYYSGPTFITPTSPISNAVMDDKIFLYGMFGLALLTVIILKKGRK